jgi:Cu(I)/Ag(I) efflux system membrane fusion protein
VRLAALLLAAVVFLETTAAVVDAQSVRDHTRLAPNRSTAVTEKQATELTLTLTAVSIRPIQIWIRTAGTIDDARKVITAELPADQGGRVSVGQRVRAFSPQSRSRMHQASISRVVPRGTSVAVTAALAGPALENSRHYILEIVTEEGEFLSVPNEAIIETGGRRLVYVLEEGGAYAQREVQLGVQGELFTQVVDGLQSGDQVVTIGSFFIDADQKLKGS